MSDTTCDSGQFLAICKKEFFFIVADNDELPISNLGALRMGLEALQKEDASDYARADQLWAKASDLLVKESQDDEGSGAQGMAQVEDTFDVMSMGGISGYP